jgi:hypothetical protein
LLDPRNVDGAKSIQYDDLCAIVACASCRTAPDLSACGGAAARGECSAYAGLANTVRAQEQQPSAPAYTCYAAGTTHDFVVNQGALFCGP